MKNLIYSFLLLFAVNAYAEIYVKQESNGDIIYSDVPMTNAKTVNLPQQKPQTISTEEVVNKAKENNTPMTAKNVYKTFRIISPADQETIQNQPTINVSLQVEPELQKNDRIQLFIDGKRFGEPSSSLQMSTGLVERGAHEMYALIIDQDKRFKIQSNVITIYVMRAHTGAPPVAPKAILPAAKKVSLKSSKKLTLAHKNNKKLSLAHKNKKKLTLAHKNNKKLKLSLKNFKKPRVSFKNDKKPKVYLAHNH